MSQRITIDPVTRIEGHLRIDCEIEKWCRFESMGFRYHVARHGRDREKSAIRAMHG